MTSGDDYQMMQSGDVRQPEPHMYRLAEAFRQALDLETTEFERLGPAGRLLLGILVQEGDAVQQQSVLRDAYQGYKTPTGTQLSDKSTFSQSLRRVRQMFRSGGEAEGIESDHTYLYHFPSRRFSKATLSKTSEMDSIRLTLAFAIRQEVEWYASAAAAGLRNLGSGNEVDALVPLVPREAVRRDQTHNAAPIVDGRASNRYGSTNPGNPGRPGRRPMSAISIEAVDRAGELAMHRARETTSDPLAQKSANFAKGSENPHYGAVGTPYSAIPILVGRSHHQALDQAIALLSSDGPRRQIYIFGPGGAGKTSVLRALRARLYDGARFGKRIFLVDLGEALSREDALREIAEEVLAHTDAKTEANLVQYFSQGQTLLLLDRMEAIPGGQALVDHLIRRTNSNGSSDSLASFGTLNVAIASQCPPRFGNSEQASDQPLVLAIRGIPEEDVIDQIGLFRYYARAVHPGWRDILRRQEEAVSVVCARLGGNPLLIRIAVSLLEHMSLHELRGVLDDPQTRLGTLVSSDRSLPARHRSEAALLRYTFDRLCEIDGCSRLLTQLLFFRGGFTRSSAQALFLGTQTRGSIDELHTFSDAWQMVRDYQFVQPWLPASGTQSLNESGGESGADSGTDSGEPGAGAPVRDTADANVARYNLPDTIRMFLDNESGGGGGAMQLAGDLLVQTQRNHRGYFLSLTRRNFTEEAATRQKLVFDELAAERLNLELCLESRTSNPAQALEIAAALQHFWFVRGYLRRGSEHLSSILTLYAQRDILRAKGLLSLAWLQLWQGQLAEAFQGFAGSRDLFVELSASEDDLELRRSHLLGGSISTIGMGQIRAYQRRYDEAESLLSEGIRCGADWRWEAVALNYLGMNAMYRGEEFVNLRHDSFDLSRRYHDQSLDIRLRHHHHLGVAVCRNRLALLDIRTGNLDAAARSSAQSLRTHLDLGCVPGIIDSLEGLSAVGLRQGTDPLQALRLFGVADQARSYYGFPTLPAQQAESDAVHERLSHVFEDNAERLAFERSVRQADLMHTGSEALIHFPL